jgi:hypothetical protein
MAVEVCNFFRQVVRVIPTGAEINVHSLPILDSSPRFWAGYCTAAARHGDDLLLVGFGGHSPSEERG